METLRYAYKPKLLTFALCGLFFAGCGVVIGKVALENDRGLILNRILRLGPDSATIFYWVLAAACVAFVVVALLGIARSFGTVREVVLDSAAISAPKNPLSQVVVVTLPFTAITDLQVTQVHRQKFLVIRHADGKLNINQSMLPTHDDFDELVEALDARVRAAVGR
jgi:hypothetical protein